MENFIMSRKVSEQDIKLLYSLSAGQCNKCSISIFIPHHSNNGYSHIGEMAHNIPFGNGKKSPRIEYKIINNLKTDNTYENLILLCSNCHKEVDSYPSYYTVDYLKKMKENHENKIKKATTNSIHKDLNTVQTIHKYCNLQFIYSQLCDANYKTIPHNITGIGNIYKLYLKQNEPTLYPFYDNNLNIIWKKIIDNYSLIYKLTCIKFTMDNPPHLRLLEHNSLSIQEIKDIENALKQLAEACKEWLDYCRQQDMLQGH